MVIVDFVPGHLPGDSGVCLVNPQQGVQFLFNLTPQGGGAFGFSGASGETIRVHENTDADQVGAPICVLNVP